MPEPERLSPVVRLNGCSTPDISCCDWCEPASTTTPPVQPGGVVTFGGGASYFCSMPTCDFCGDYTESDDLPITWTSAVEGGRQKFFCSICSRDHLRSMEAKLDSEWW